MLRCQTVIRHEGRHTRSYRKVSNEESERLGRTAEEVIRLKVNRIIREFNGLFGKVMADLIAEGQSQPEVLRDLYEQHMRSRRAFTRADLSQTGSSATAVYTSYP